ncbi:protocadherin-11 X-linked-like [Saccoglossus kowalevskii]|uniref:Protocadherin-18-like n=1 Tax=Saccoglossus kowalevskii TaxID=10224 RepID=A0ABM0H0C2_SACKO|nr:PREDICTED: protocadherin-18-like [Saccoglossus kowalevskii]
MDKMHSFLRTVAVRLVLFVLICIGKSLTTAWEIEYSIFEEQPPGIPVGNLISDLGIEEAGMLGAYDFRFFQPPNGNGSFLQVGGRSGVLTTTQTVDRERLCANVERCIHEVIITFQHQSVEFVKIRIEVLDLNDHAPTFPQNIIWIDISETTAIGSTFPQGGSLFAVDPDAGNNTVQLYELYNSYSDTFGLNAYYSIVEEAIVAEIVVLTTLDREETSFYELVLVAKDFGNPIRSGSALINVSLIDENDHIPDFQQNTYHVEVSENMADVVEFLVVHAVDLDDGVNGQVVYSFSPRTPPYIQELFAIDSVSGAMKTLQSLDYEAQQHFQIIIQATDLGPSPTPTYATVIIDVADLNDNFPVISLSSTSAVGTNQALVSEAVSPNYEVAYVTISDADSGLNGQMTLQLINSNNDFVLKEIYTNELYILTVGQHSLDREIIAEYNLTLQATDAGDDPKSSRAYFFVKLADINDNFPVFSKRVYTAQIPENNIVGAYITKVTALDPDLDANGQVEYVLWNYHHEFDINIITGEITAKKLLDYEERSFYNINVTACDHGTVQQCSDATVRLFILDQNDHAPFFSQNSYTFSVSENLPPDTSIGKIRASDLDTGENSRLIYSLLGEHSQQFRINHRTGDVFTQVSFNYESETQCDLVVMVTDHGTPARTDSATVHVAIIDQNDNKPVIIYPQGYNIIYVPLSAKPGLAVMTIQAADADDGQNGELRYYITDGNIFDLFQISETTGEIYTAKNLEENLVGLHKITVKVEDQGVDKQSVSLRLNVIISDLPFNHSLVNYTNIGNLTEVLPPAKIQTFFLFTVSGIAILVLGSLILVLVIVVVIIIVRCRTNEKAVRTYNFRREESLFNTSKSTSRTATPQNVANTVDAYLAMQSPDVTCVTPGLMHAGSFDKHSGMGSSVMIQNMYNDNSESIRSSHSGIMPMSDTDAEVDQLLSFPTKHQQDQQDEIASYDSGRGESDRDAREHNSANGLASNSQKDHKETDDALEDTSYMASPRCTVECKTLGHSDQCWMPPQEPNPRQHRIPVDIPDNYLASYNCDDRGMASPTYSDSDSSPDYELENGVQWPIASFTSFGYDPPKPAASNTNFDRQGSARLRHHLFSEPLTPITEHPAESLTELLEGAQELERQKKNDLHSQMSLGDHLSSRSSSTSSGNSYVNRNPPNDSAMNRAAHRQSPKSFSDYSCTMSESSLSEGEFEIDSYPRKNVVNLLDNQRETAITDDGEHCDAAQLVKHIDSLFFSDSTV